MNHFLFAPVTDAQRQRDALLGALVGLARSTVNEPKTEDTDRVLASGLRLAADPDAAEDALRRMYHIVETEKHRVAPNCAICTMRCGNTDNYESVTYEGYGPGGVAVIVEALTDNRQRTAPEVRHYFDKYGKGMGAQGCVSWSFDRKGVIIIDNEDGDYDEDAVMMDALDAGADDFNAEDNVFEITTDPDAFNDVVKALEEKNYAFVSADISLVPQTYVKLESDEDIKNMEKLLDMLEDNEDVQNTYHNWDQD